MEYLSYLAAHQLVSRLTAEQFVASEVVSDGSASGQPRFVAVRVAFAALLRRTADRVEPVGVTSGSL
jgi:hypothetical protein